MAHDMREVLERLDAAGELIRITRPVDPMHISAVIKQTGKAVMIEKAVGYDFPVVGGLFRDFKKTAIAMGFNTPAEAQKYIIKCLDEPLIPPVLVDKAPCQEVTLEEADLTVLPYPLQHYDDGGPYIGSAIQFSRDPQFGDGAGIYRMMFRTKNTTGIDFNSPSDMRLWYERRLRKGESLPLAISIGNNIIELIAAAAPIDIGKNEMGFAGRLYGEPVQMVKCLTNDLAVPAASEIVLEGEILPTGWTADEGRFGEATRVSGEVKWNPVVKINRITHRKDAIFYSLLMHDEVQGLALSTIQEYRVLRVLRDVGVQPVAVRSSYNQVFVSIKEARPGQGKTAAAAVLSLFNIKNVTIVNDDIDVFDDDDIRWALSQRFQADRDLIVISCLPGKHLDVSLRTWNLPPGVMPTTSKMGIDATRKPDIPGTYAEKTRHYMVGEFDVQTYYDSARKK
jgi:2,5-furandicarboxylate decarboxylase 1